MTHCTISDGPLFVTTNWPFSRVRRTILNFHGEIMCIFGATNIYGKWDHGSAKSTSPNAIFYLKKKWTVFVGPLRWKKEKVGWNWKIWHQHPTVNIFHRFCEWDMIVRDLSTFVHIRPTRIFDYPLCKKKRENWCLFLKNSHHHSTASDWFVSGIWSSTSKGSTVLLVKKSIFIELIFLLQFFLENDEINEIW